MWKYSKKNQSGFTLVELAIVLVIIGLILAAVLKGQQMIENGKVKNVVNDMKGIVAAYYSYQDRYKAVPGDDAAASSHATGAVNGGGDGAITGLFDAAVAPSATAESNNFWQHTRMTGFLTGIATAAEAKPPTNSVGGVLGVQSHVSAAGGSTYGMTGMVVCASNVPWKIAQAVDILQDDGDSATGTVRAGATATTATAATTSAVYGPAVIAPNTEGIHTICMKI
ncbi:MAG: prepilin-type N-terminal cleavage/methylation domain-containing protein [Gallionella sp.]|nr:prepilin-type N-terminal cleavage/methylation domain-containing protein [Gallionella sp.]